MARLRGVAASAVAALVAAGLASACATVPTAGRPTQVTGANGQGQPFVQPVPPRPERSWNEQAIVRGFMAASASFDHHHAAARAFLSPQLRKNWRPGWAAVVVSGRPKATLGHVGPRSLAGQTTQVASVSLAGHQTATISNIGQYLVSPASKGYTFKLAKFNGQWLITQLPEPSVLLLTQADFEQAYQPRNLYVWSRDHRSLLPEPVFAPHEGIDFNREVASNLATALLTNQPQASWLGSDTKTAFPRGTKLLGPANAQVTLNGSTAVVNLGGTAAKASLTRLTDMAAQLVTTLTSTSYGQTAISRSVAVEINGQPLTIGGQQVLQPDSWLKLIPGFRQPRTPLYFVGTNGAVSELSPATTKPKTVQREPGGGLAPFSQIAVSPGDQPWLAGATRTKAGCVVYFGPLGTPSMPHVSIPSQLKGACTSLSWDSQGNIWAVADHSVWVLSPANRHPMAVVLPQVPGVPSYRVLALRVAPDGVRAAMLLQRSGGQHELALTAISGTGSGILLSAGVSVGASVDNPTAMSWYDPDHLIVVSRSQLYQVPANGGRALAVGAVQLDTRSVTALGPGQVATSGSGEVFTSSGPDENQEPAAKGTSPAYPG
jgi:hypothetical protein